MGLSIFQYIILGIVQGITEWIPISSSGILVLIMSNFFGITDVQTLLSQLLLLHLGTFFAALIYLRKDVAKLFRTLFNYKRTDEEEKGIFNFILITSLITGVIGILFLYLIDIGNFSLTGKIITFIVGFLLMITGLFQIKIKTRGLRKESSLNKNDGIILGIAQGFSSLPGISRSGITISSLLLRKFDDTSALKLSFLMSLPVILFGNLLLNYKELVFSNPALYGILASFVFGFLTISGLMSLSKKINFGWFVLIFALLMMLSVII